MVAPGLLAVCGGIQHLGQLRRAERRAHPGCTPSATAPATFTPGPPINIQGNSYGRCLVQGSLGEQLAGVYQEIGVIAGSCENQ